MLFLKLPQDSPVHIVLISADASPELTSGDLFTACSLSLWSISAHKQLANIKKLTSRHAGVGLRFNYPGHATAGALLANSLHVKIAGGIIVGWRLHNDAKADI
jgi:hypothetical protein